MTPGYSEEDYLRGMQRGWCGGLSDGTPCGSGSRIDNTANIRKRLPDLVKELEVRSICDAGAGDRHWMQLIEWDVGYQGFDLFPRDSSVKRCDIRSEPLPSCDLIICRQVMNHMCAPDVLRTLELFRRSGQYLLATHHAVENRPDRFESYNNWNLLSEPFALGVPLELIPDHRDFFVGLWRLT